MALIEILIERFALHNQDLWPFCQKRCADFASPRALNGVQTLKSPDFSEIVSCKSSESFGSRNHGQAMLGSK